MPMFHILVPMCVVTADKSSSAAYSTSHQEPAYTAIYYWLLNYMHTDYALHNTNSSMYLQYCKTLCDWFFSGLMISGFARASAVLKDCSYLQSAVKAAQFVKRYLYNSESGTLVRNAYRDSNGQV